MPKGYKQLTYEQRCQISVLKKSKISQRSISSILKVSPSTVSRELTRNKGKRGYKEKQADGLSVARRSKANSIKYRITDEAKEFVLDQLATVGSSPVQISGRMVVLGLNKISHESIYRIIADDKKGGGSLYKSLRRRGKKYNYRRGKTSGRGCIPGRIDIDERPSIVEKKERWGDIELDTIIGVKHKGAIVSMVDRASKLTKLALVKSKEAALVTEAIINSLTDFIIETFTADNGKEFASHAIITKETGAPVYFAKPYQSWQRGLNEHTNGLVREYFPKGTDFHSISESDVQRVENILNNRPRKILNFKTPNEVMRELTDLHNVALHC